MFAADKRQAFSFHENRKNQFIIFVNTLAFKDFLFHVIYASWKRSFFSWKIFYVENNFPVCGYCGVWKLQIFSKLHCLWVCRTFTVACTEFENFKVPHAWVWSLHCGTYRLWTFSKLLCVWVSKHFENFKAFQCWSLWQSVLWDVKTLKCKFSNVGDIVVTVMWYVQTLKLFSFLVWGLCVVACKHVENFKVPYVCGSISYWTDWWLFSKTTYRDFSL